MTMRGGGNPIRGVYYGECGETLRRYNRFVANRSMDDTSACGGATVTEDGKVVRQIARAHGSLDEFFAFSDVRAYCAYERDSERFHRPKDGKSNNSEWGIRWPK